MRENLGVNKNMGYIIEICLFFSLFSECQFSHERVKSVTPIYEPFSFQKCVAMCMDRYMDSFNLVSRAYSERIRRESNNM